jgi:hypothetical protein
MSRLGLGSAAASLAEVVGAGGDDGVATASVLGDAAVLDRGSGSLV